MSGKIVAAKKHSELLTVKLFIEIVEIAET
jgi:hypothetical protein